MLLIRYFYLLTILLIFLSSCSQTGYHQGYIISQQEENRDPPSLTEEDSIR